MESLIRLRIYVEAAIDFPDEEIDFSPTARWRVTSTPSCPGAGRRARGGQAWAPLLREGMKVVIAGRPNAGKSSLLNALAGRESAIVTEIAGTTRDVLREHIHLDGMPLHIIDTAGPARHPGQGGTDRHRARLGRDRTGRPGAVHGGWHHHGCRRPREIWLEFVDRLPKTSASPWCATRPT